MGVITIEQDNRLKIAVVQEQIGGLREQQRAHYTVTQARFDQLENKVDELIAVMNRGRGAYAASMGIGSGYRRIFAGDGESRRFFFL